MAQKHRADYLSQDSVQVEEIKRHFEQVVTESKNLSDGFNAYIEAAQDETAALHELSRYYPIPDVGADVDLNCQEPAKDAAIRAAYDSEEIERLAMDKSFRDEFVKSERLNNKSNLEADARLVQVLKEHEQLRTGLTQYAEGRKDSFALSIWDCLNTLLGKRLL